MLVWKLIPGWVMILVLLVGPYAALCYFFWPFAVAYHLLYWVTALMYLGFGFVSSASITREDLITAAIPNPFSYEDEWAQRRIFFNLMLMPAIVMAWTLQVTWALIFPPRK